MMRTVPSRPVRRRPGWRDVVGFAALFLLLYALAFAWAERRVARTEGVHPFQQLWQTRGTEPEWIVLGASHALPLIYGDVPARVRRDAGQDMLVLAEVGAGPGYMRVVVEQALIDLRPKNLVYVIDDFALRDAAWNEDRLADRALLRLTPTRTSTAHLLAGAIRDEGGDPRALADYLTGFSKLNPPDRFTTAGWRGAADFDRVFRPSAAAVAGRIDYLYPDGGAPVQPRYMAALDALVARARAAGLDVVVIRPPLPRAFQEALPPDDALDTLLDGWQASGTARVLDLTRALEDPRLYFDTDHLNRAGVERLYSDHLLPLIRDQR